MSSQKTRHQKLVPGGGGGQLCPHIERMKYKHACTIKIRSPKVKIYVQNLKELLVPNNKIEEN